MIVKLNLRSAAKKKTRVEKCEPQIQKPWQNSMERNLLLITFWFLLKLVAASWSH